MCHLLCLGPSVCVSSISHQLLQFQFSVAGEGQVGRGSPPMGQPDVTLTMCVEDMRGMLQGDLSMFGAYMGGRLEVDGDLSAANKLGNLAETVRARLQNV